MNRRATRDTPCDGEMPASRSDGPGTFDRGADRKGSAEAPISVRDGWVAGPPLPDHAEVSVELDVPATMRDGTVLRANVYRPVRARRAPTLLARTPYSKDSVYGAVDAGVDPIQAAKLGFMVVVQDVRGRFGSDGEWSPLAFERADGFDSVEWAARLPGSNGSVGMYGPSYCGNTQWMAARERPSGLRAISPNVTWSEPLDGAFARAGAIELGLVVAWSLETGVDHMLRTQGAAEDGDRRLAALLDEFDRLAVDGYWRLPVEPGMVVAGHGLEGPVGMPSRDVSPLAEVCRVTGAYDEVSVPSLHTTGWYDAFVQGAIDNYCAMAERGAEARLVVGPWTHTRVADPVGEQVFGIRGARDGPAETGQMTWSDLQLAWFERHLVPNAEVALPTSPVRIFVMGRNIWRDESSWPPSRASLGRWFLRSDGWLRREPDDARGASSRFIYDPADPVPTRGGNTVMPAMYPAGPMDQRMIEARADVLTFTSAPLTSDLEVAGRVRVVLNAASSAPSTDFVARLCDVYPDGRSINICDGIVRLARDADTAGEHTVDLWSTCNVFRAGHRLRVDVTSSSFPRWDRNLNTGDQSQSRQAKARQVIYHDTERASFIDLPIVA